VLIRSALKFRSNPVEHTKWGVIILVFSLITVSPITLNLLTIIAASTGPLYDASSWFISFLGYFVNIGSLVGILGGINVLAYKPQLLVPEPPPDMRVQPYVALKSIDITSPNEGILEILESGSQSLIFTSRRLIIMINRGAAVGSGIGIVIMIVLIISVGYLIGLILGLVATVIIGVLVGKPKDYSKVSVESILSMNHEEIYYPQVEKVELKKSKLKFFYVVYGGARKKKQFIIKNGSLHQRNLALLNSVLPGRVIEK
jgi:hypothetical protein